MAKKPSTRCQGEVPLIPDLGELVTIDPIEFVRLRHPIWTENKAKLIERYIFYFEQITHHGTYIDGFAGPQEPNKPGMWAARLALEVEPRWFRHFYLFELDKEKIPLLEQLRDSQPDRDGKGRKLNRDIQIKQGDCNVMIPELLDSKCIPQKEATFCLLDQWTFECKWSTVQALSAYKLAPENKIEIFYFLPNSWQDRALAGLKVNKHRAKEWWGDGIEPEELQRLGTDGRRDGFVAKFKDELNYKHVHAFPIYERPRLGGAIMYYMIHATDHAEAPKLMARAYNRAVGPMEKVEQLELLFPEE